MKKVYIAFIEYNQPQHVVSTVTSDSIESAKEELKAMLKEDLGDIKIVDIREATVEDMEAIKKMESLQDQLMLAEENAPTSIN